jgi:hypothetical protein
VEQSRETPISEPEPPGGGEPFVQFNWDSRSGLALKMRPLWQAMPKTGQSAGHIRASAKEALMACRDMLDAMIESLDRPGKAQRQQKRRIDVQ